MTDGAPGRPKTRGHGPRRAGRQVALEAVFEAEFGQRTAAAVLDRILAERPPGASGATLARAVVDGVVRDRQGIDDLIAATAPAYPVQALARIDRALLRCALSEVLHCRATPQRAAIAEWVELARTYSGEPARRLVNGVLGRVAATMTPGLPEHPAREGPTARQEGARDRVDLRSDEEDRRRAAGRR